MRLFLICLSLLYVIGVSYAQRFKAALPVCADHLTFLEPQPGTGGVGDSLNGQGAQGADSVYVLTVHDRQPVDGLTIASGGCRN